MLYIISGHHEFLTEGVGEVPVETFQQRSLSGTGNNHDGQSVGLHLADGFPGSRHTFSLGI